MRRRWDLKIQCTARRDAHFSRIDGDSHLAEFAARPKLLFGSFVGVFLLEALDAARGVDHFLLAGKKGMATGADFDSDQVALLGGAGFKCAPAGAVDGYGVIIGMDSFFH